MVPREDDAWKRFRDREDEENEKEDTSLAAKRGATGKADLAHVAKGASSNEKLQQLIDQATPLIEQLNNLYNQFFAGAERTPPIERRKQLDQTMASIMLSSKPTPQIQFRCQTLNQAYISARDRWDRMMKDWESGKLKRAR